MSHLLIAPKKVGSPEVSGRFHYRDAIEYVGKFTSKTEEAAYKEKAMKEIRRAFTSVCEF